MLDEFIGQILADKYRVDSVLRESGLGKAYRGTHLLMDKPVTIKILFPSLAVDKNIVKRFSAEARAVSHISHPNILSVTDVGSDPNGTVFIVLDGAEGSTLKEVIEREGKFSQSRAESVARQIAAALSAAHSAGLVHHHLNSNNILIGKTPDEEDFVKVLELGSVREDEDLKEETDVKKFEYLAPEQNSSVQEADERADIYALGVIFYEMLTGEVPFTAETSTALMLKQAEEPPVPLSAFRDDLPAYIEPIILKALAKNPEMRYQTAAEFLDDLNSSSEHSTGTETLVIPEEIDNRTGNLWKTAFVVLAGISLLAIGLIYATSVKQTDPTTQLQTDANGSPVQPLNPATGLNEQGLANMMTSIPPDFGGNGNFTIPPQPNTLPGGDGYDPWARGGVPPPGAPYPVPPGGQVYTIPGDANGNPFMPPLDGQYILVPQPPNTNTNTNTATAKPSPTPKGTSAPVNTQPQTSPTPKETTPTTPPETKPTPVPKPTKTPPKPTESPKPNPPASTEKLTQSGKEQDS